MQNYRQKGQVGFSIIMIVKKTQNTLIQAEYDKDRVIVKKGSSIVSFTFKEVETINGCMEGEYMSNNQPQKQITLDTVPELDDTRL